MGGRQFYIEEDFPSHPKVLRAGGDAAWLHVCALAWASKHLTGDIPKNSVAQLSDRRSPMRLATTLVEVGLWHDRGDHYQLHDWEARNKKMLSARRKAKYAAEVRYGRAGPDAPSMPGALLGACPELCLEHASRASDPKNQRSKEPKNPGTNDCANTSSPLGGDEDAGIEPANHTEALRKLARRDMDDRNRDCPDAEPIASEFSWLLKAMQRRRIEYAHVLARISPTLDADAIIDEIDHDKPDRKRKPNWSCDTCEGSSMVAADDAETVWTFCPECHPRGRKTA